MTARRHTLVAGMKSKAGSLAQYSVLIRSSDAEVYSSCDTFDRLIYGNPDALQELYGMIERDDPRAEARMAEGMALSADLRSATAILDVMQEACKGRVFLPTSNSYMGLAPVLYPPCQ